MKFKRIAIDTSKHVFTLHGVGEQERPVLRRNLKRSEVEAYFSKLDSPKCCWKRAAVRITGAAR